MGSKTDAGCQYWWMVNSRIGLTQSEGELTIFRLVMEVRTSLQGHCPSYRSRWSLLRRNELLSFRNPAELYIGQAWITPSIFADKPDWVVDEWTYGEYMRTQDDAYGEISTHWNTWFQYEELQKWAVVISSGAKADWTSIAAVGLNTIRIQIGCKHPTQAAR